MHFFDNYQPTHISFSVACPFVAHLRIQHKANIEPVIYSELIPFDITFWVTRTGKRYLRTRT